MNLQQKLIITFLTISIIPMLIIGSLFLDNSRTALVKARLEGLESIANLKVKTLEKTMGNLRDDVKIAQDYLNIKSNLPVLIRLADERENPVFIQAKKKLDSQLKALMKIKSFEDIMLISPEGIVRYVANEKHAAMDVNLPLSDKVVFEEGKKGIYFSKVAKIRGNDSANEILIAAPIHSVDGIFIGAIVFEVDMTPIYQLMQDTTGMGDTGETLIGRDMGDYALFLNPTRYDPDAAMKRKAVFGSPNAFPMQEAVRGRSNSGISVDYRGEEILAVWRYVPSRHWGLVAKLNSSEAFESIAVLMNLAAISGFIIMMVMVFIAISIARSFSRPIQSLKEGIVIIGNGNLDHRVSTNRKDEIGELSQAFDEMSSSLKSATASRDEFETEAAERKHAEQLLRESEARINAIVDNLVDGLITIDEKGTVDSFNPAAEKLFGYRADEVVGNNVNMLMPQPYHSAHNSYLQSYLETHEAKIIGIGREVIGKHKDGSTFPMDLGISEIDIDGKRLFAGTVRNISERRAAEQAIANQNRELALHSHYDQSYAKVMALFSSTYSQDKVLSGLLSVLADNHPFPVSAIYVYDEWSGTLKLDASHGASDALKKEFERGESLIGQAAMDNKAIMLEEFDEAGLSIEVGVLSFAPACVIINPVIFQDETVGVLVLAASKVLTDQDIPFLDRLAAQLGVAMNNLRQHRDLMDITGQLKQRGEDITQQNQQLEQASRMKSEFLANMSHELRTPLNAIIGFSEVLKDGIMGEMSPEQTEYIGDIFNSGQHLLSLINDILDLSKIEAGKMKLDLEEISVPNLLNNSLSIVKEKAMAHRIILSQDISEDMKPCWLDGRKTKQIVYNLLSNAVKFTPNGGSVCVRARKIKREPDVYFLEISVTDTGIGISEADQKKLFTAFIQADSSLARKFEGTGLGLVMVKRLAELHGGTVDMQSKEGKGSTFTVWLPWRTETMEDEPDILNSEVCPESHHNSDIDHETDPVIGQVSGDSGTAPAGQLSVLIVEDEDPAAELMRLQLEDKGYRTSRAFSAENALEILAVTKPDLITLDILMPGMDGWDLLAILKEDKGLTHIPVVIVSIVADKKKGFSLGAAQVLQKPVSKKLLLDSLAGTGLGIDHGITGTVLVVDDDPKAVDFISRHLENSGATVLRAYGGAEAIEQATEKQPDLIILDLMMPEITGFDVVDALKTNKKTALIPIMILTAKVITDEDRKALNGGILKIVEKSGFNHGAFINEVQRATTKLLKAKPDTGHHTDRTMGRKTGKNGKN